MQQCTKYLSMTDDENDENWLLVEFLFPDFVLLFKLETLNSFIKGTSKDVFFGFSIRFMRASPYLPIFKSYQVGEGNVEHNCTCIVHTSNEKGCHLNCLTDVLSY